MLTYIWAHSRVASHDESNSEFPGSCQEESQMGIRRAGIHAFVHLEHRTCFKWIFYIFILNLSLVLLMCSWSYVSHPPRTGSIVLVFWNNSRAKNSALSTPTVNAWEALECGSSDGRTGGQPEWNTGSSRDGTNVVYREGSKPVEHQPCLAGGGEPLYLFFPAVLQETSSPVSWYKCKGAKCANHCLYFLVNAKIHLIKNCIRTLWPRPER